MSVEVVTESTNYAEHATTLIGLMNDKVVEVVKNGLVQEDVGDSISSLIPVRLQGFDQEILNILSFDSDRIDRSVIAAHNHPVFLDVVYEYFIKEILDDGERGRLAYFFRNAEVSKYDWCYFMQARFSSVEPIAPTNVGEFLDSITTKLKTLHKAFYDLYVETGGVFKTEKKGPDTNFGDLLGNVITKMSNSLINLKLQLQNE